MPLELITGVVTLILTAIGSIWRQKVESQVKLREMEIRSLQATTESQDAAAKRPDEKISFTRRTIALTLVFAVVVLPKLAYLYNPELNIVVGYYELNPGFWFFTDDHEVIKWYATNGFPLTPVDSHAFFAATGYYFGNKVGVR